jgi:hypothetical protein
LLILQLDSMSIYRGRRYLHELLMEDLWRIDPSNHSRRAQQLVSPADARERARGLERD